MRAILTLLVMLTAVGCSAPTFRPHFAAASAESVWDYDLWVYLHWKF